MVAQSTDGSTCTKPLMQNSECLRSMTCELTSGNCPKALKNLCTCSCTQKNATYMYLLAFAAQDPPGCTYSPWTDWSACPVTCGVGQAFRKRMLVSSAPTASCRDFEMENSKCMTSASCLNDEEQRSAPACSYAEWSEWMPCSASCGIGSTLRKRFLTGKGTCILWTL